MSPVVRFDCFEVDLNAGILRKRGMRIGLRDQPFQVLASLLERPGQVVTRDDLRRRLWSDEVFVDFDDSLNIAISRLRTALGDSAEHSRFIETLPKRGYRFIADVTTLPFATGPEPIRRPRLVVLPFLNLSGDPAQEYFSDAMTDEIITDLASLTPERLAVIAHASAMRYKGSHKDVARIARELGVDYVVEGAFRSTEDRVAVNVQLIQASDQAHLFARRFEVALRDIFDMQRSIAQDIAAHIPSIAGGMPTEQVTRKPTENLTAYKEYLRGRHELWNWTPEGAGKAKRHFEAALAHDPSFALACDALANLYWHLGFWGFLPPDETEPSRRFYALRAAELDPTLIESRAILAFNPEKRNYTDPYSYDWRETEKQMARARDLKPNSPLIRLRHATVLGVLGEHEQAISEMECALESDLLSPELRFWFAEVLLLSRQFERPSQKQGSW